MAFLFLLHCTSSECGGLGSSGHFWLERPDSVLLSDDLLGLNELTCGLSRPFLTRLLLRCPGPKP